MSLVIQSWANLPKHRHENIPSTSITERAGYRTTKQIIEEMTRSGELLLAHRKAVYDNVIGGQIVPNDQLQVDPTRDRGLDLAEGQAISENLQYKARQAKKQAQEKANAEKVAQEAKKASEKPPTDK